MRSFCFHLFLLLPILGHAQQAITINCRFLALQSAPPPLITLSEAGAVISCNVPTSSLSPPTPCLAKGNIVTFLSAADKKPAATATIPANAKAAILVFVASPNSANGLPWRVFAIEDSPKNFPDGGAFVTNFHSQNIRFVIGENKLMLQPAKSLGCVRPEKRDDFNMAPVAFEFQQGGAWRPASETLLQFLPGNRYLMFAYVDAASGRPRVSTFQDAKRGSTEATP